MGRLKDNPTSSLSYYDGNDCDDDDKRSDSVRWVDRKISRHHLRFPFLLQPAKVHGRPSVTLKMILK